MGDRRILAGREELLGRQRPVVVHVSVELGNHPEVVHENRVLIDVLEDAELSISQRELDSVFKMLVHVLQTADGRGPHVHFLVIVPICRSLLPALSLNGLAVHDSDRQPRADASGVDLATATLFVRPGLGAIQTDAHVRRALSKGGISTSPLVHRPPRLLASQL